MRTRPVQREVVAAMVGTAGHVDHGKTTLVMMMTGCDTDRLAEEKARGLSINLGFAPCILPGRRTIGIVDVPGHRDFIRNMVAGAASIDVLMLVTAADDGVMPQTAEHMQIIRLLRKPQVMVALTKVDLVDEETRELARDDVASFLTRLGYEDVPIIETSSVTGEGLVEVREKLLELVERVVDRPSDERRFRMNVERVFSVEGYGTVATGIPTSGRVRVGEKLTLLPSGKETVVRAIQLYKNDSDEAMAGACAAINVRDLGPEDVDRGMALVAPGGYEAADSFLATLESVAADRALKRRFECKLHAGTSIADATVKLLGAESLPPGATGVAHVQLSEPVTLAAGDRYVIRSLSPVTTVGGGTLLSVAPGRIKRSSPHLLPRLDRASEAADRGDVLVPELLAGPRSVLRTEDLLRLARADEATARAQISALLEQGVLEELGSGGFLVLPRLAELADRMARELERYHDAHPTTWGMTTTHACESAGLPPRCFGGLREALARDDRIVVRHGHLAHRDREPALSARQKEQREGILRLVGEAGAKPPAVGDLSQKLGISTSDMKLLTRMLAEEGRIRVVGTNVLSTEAVEACRRRLVGLFTDRDEVSLADFREATGLSRNVAWTLLDVFDGEGLTRKIGDVRVRISPTAREGDET